MEAALQMWDLRLPWKKNVTQSGICTAPVCHVSLSNSTVVGYRGRKCSWYVLPFPFLYFVHPSDGHNLSLSSSSSFTCCLSVLCTDFPQFPSLLAICDAGILHLLHLLLCVYKYIYMYACMYMHTHHLLKLKTSPQASQNNLTGYSNQQCYLLTKGYI